MLLMSCLLSAERRILKDTKIIKEGTSSLTSVLKLMLRRMCPPFGLLRRMCPPFGYFSIFVSFNMSRKSLHFF